LSGNGRRCNACPPRPTILVLGEERAGLTPLQRDLCSDFVRIPMIGAADSLNLAVAGSLLLYEVYRADGSDVASQTRRCGGGAIASPVLWRAEHSGVKLAVPGWMRRSVGEKACTGFGLRRACAQIRLMQEVGEIGQRLGLGCARGSAFLRTSEELGKLRLARALPVIGRSHRLLLRSRGRLLHGAAEKRTELDHGLHEDLQDNGKPVHEFGAVWKLARSRSTRCGPKMYSRCSAKHFLDSQALGTSEDTTPIIDKRTWSWSCELMARLARVVAPGFPHHITQRGNRRQQAFFCNEDYQRYVENQGTSYAIRIENRGTSYSIRIRIRMNRNRGTSYSIRIRIRMNRGTSYSIRGAGNRGTSESGIGGHQNRGTSYSIRGAALLMVSPDSLNLVSPESAESALRMVARESGICGIGITYGGPGICGCWPSSAGRDSLTRRFA
jgi:SpoU rRNA Methylase family